MPEGRASGRSEATSIDGVEHGGTIFCVMPAPGPRSTSHDPTRSDRELPAVRRLRIMDSPSR
jgi:hypothetical protein